MKRLGSIVIALVLCSFTLRDNTPGDELYFLRNSIERIVHQVDPNANIGIEVVSLKNGQTFFEKNGSRMFVPASLIKMFTGAAALSMLGVDYQFQTSLLSEKPITNGVLDGDLYLKGSGDPSLAICDLEELVFRLKLLGIKEIKGNLIVDNFDFDDTALGPGWMWDEGSDSWNALTDALTVNHGSVSLWVKPAQKVGQAPEVVLSPPNNYVVIRNFAKTSEKIESLSVGRKWVTKENIIEISGSIPLKNTTKTYDIAVEQPWLYTAVLFRDILRKADIRFIGDIHRKQVPTDAKILVCHCSAALPVLVRTMMKDTDNLYANCFFKKMGQKVGGSPGTWQKGSQAVLKFLSDEVKLDTSKLVYRDGDGQSRYNLASPDQLIAFLTWAKNKYPFFPEFFSALPISGTDGTLKKRMQEDSVKGKVHAKTGTMTGISTLAGYIQTKDDETLAFAIMTNGFIKPASEFKEKLEDQICTQLAQFSRN